MPPSSIGNAGKPNPIASQVDPNPHGAPDAGIRGLVDARIGRITRGLLYLAVFVSCMVLLFNYAEEGRFSKTMQVVALSLPFLFALLVVAKRGYPQAAAVGLVLLVFLVMIGVVATRGTVRVPAASLIIVTSALSGLVLGRRLMIAVMAIGIVLLGVLTFAESQGMLRAPQVGPLWSFWLSISVFAGATGSILFYGRGLAEDALSRAAREIAERKQAEQAICRLNEEAEQARAIREAEIVALNQMLERQVEARTAQLAEANRELEAFSYSVSHDLRAPLRHLDGFAHLLAEEQGSRLDDAGRQLLARIRGSAKRMNLLIDDLLELSHVGRVELRHERVDMTGLAHEILASLAAAEPDRRVETEVADGVVAEADPGLIRVALENLIGNAWKYTARKERAFIAFGAELHEEGGTRYFVRDNGAGFDARFADRLFQPFQRLHGQHEFEGTGVGLATVQRIVARHGGQIWAEAAPERGATFRFRLGAPTAS